MCHLLIGWSVGWSNSFQKLSKKCSQSFLYFSKQTWYVCTCNQSGDSQNFFLWLIFKNDHEIKKNKSTGCRIILPISCLSGITHENRSRKDINHEPTSSLTPSLLYNLTAYACPTVIDHSVFVSLYVKLFLVWFCIVLPLIWRVTWPRQLMASCTQS